MYYVRAVTADALAFYSTRAAALADTGRIALSDGSTGQTHYLYSAKADVFVDVAGAVTINVSNDGDTPTIRLRDGASVTVNNIQTYTLTGLVAGSEVRIFRVSDGVELAGVESSAASFAYPYNYVSDVAVRIVVQRLGYIWQQRSDTLGASSVTRPVIMQTDFNYANP